MGQPARAIMRCLAHDKSLIIKKKKKKLRHGFVKPAGERERRFLFCTNNSVFSQNNKLKFAIIFANCEPIIVGLQSKVKKKTVQLIA